MQSLLRHDALLERILGYVELRAANALPGPNPESPVLKKDVAYMLQDALLRGKVGRGDMIRVSGLTERTGRKVLRLLLEEGLLVWDMPKGPVRLALPMFAAEYYFPDLYPGSHIMAHEATPALNPGRKLNRHSAQAIIDHG
jgi:hypothetical protein